MGGPETNITATRELGVTMAPDELPGFFGVSSVLILPGVVFMLTLLEWSAAAIERGGNRTLSCGRQAALGR